MTMGTEETRVRTDAQRKLRQAGLDDRIRVLHLQHRELRDNGFLVDLDVTGISMFYAKIDWYYDLGVPQEDARRQSKRLTPGRKCLLRDAKLRSLETRVRRNLEINSFTLAVFGGYRYVPDTAFAEWYEGHQAIVDEFDEEKRRIVNRYPILVQQLADDFEAMARETWWTLAGRASVEPEAADWIEEHNITAFAQAVVDKAISQMPTVQEIEAKLHIHLRPMATFLLAPEEQADQLEAERLRIERDEQRAEHDYWTRIERARAEEMEAKAAASWTEARERQRAAVMQANEEIERTRHETTVIKAEQLRLAREAVANMQSPFQEAIESLRGQIVSVAREVLENIRQHGRVLGKTAEKIDNMRATFNLLNIGGDRDLEAALDGLRDAMQSPGVEYKRDTGMIVTALNEVVAVGLQEAKAAAELTQLGGWDMLEV